MRDVPYGFCRCGCGEKTRACPTDRLSLGYVKGEPQRYVLGHNRRRSPVERFWEKVDKNGPGGCWLWLGNVELTGGYGRLRVGAKLVLAHRFAYELLVGPIPGGLTLDHVRARGCMHRNCVNPAHLEPVTNRENSSRGDGVGAVNTRKTHCPKGHPYAGDNLYVIPSGGRACRICRSDRASTRKRDRRKKT